VEKQNAVTLLKQLVPERIKRWVKHSAGVPSTEAALRHLKGRGFDPATVIDVGANVGEWTRMCKRLWPKASVLMIEPLPECEAPLARLASELPGVRYQRALLGANDRAAVSIHCCDTASSVLQEYEAKHPTLAMPMTRLDDCSVGAELLKLDVQGYELEILKGGQKVLSSAAVVLLEGNLLDLHIGVPLAHEVLQFMAEHDFVLYDTGDFYRRPLDQALWCMDLVFVRRDGEWRLSKRWA
jgi:FkbM family methyltransferase